jgi:hypothetical protein
MKIDSNKLAFFFLMGVMAFAIFAGLIALITNFI